MHCTYLLYNRTWFVPYYHQPAHAPTHFSYLLARIWHLVSLSRSSYLVISISQLVHSSYLEARGPSSFCGSSLVLWLVARGWGLMAKVVLYVWIPPFAGLLSTQRANSIHLLRSRNQFMLLLHVLYDCVSLNKNKKNFPIIQFISMDCSSLFYVDPCYLPLEIPFK
jgi:hypothetical protein